MHLPRLALGSFPSPVSSEQIGNLKLLVKHDEQCDDIYAGNKLRKLEYLLAQALGHGATTVATFGAAGSNHALATAMHARRLGLRPLVFLCSQQITPGIPATLRAHQKLGSQLVYWSGSKAQRRQIVRSAIRAYSGKTWVIPMGGSSWSGSVGFVAAAAELAAQLRRDEAPAPERIYLPLGTMGSVAGLAVGLRAAGLTTTVVAVRVVEPTVAGDEKLVRFGNKIVAMCQQIDPAFSAAGWERLIELREEFLGGGYAVATPEAVEAVTIARQSLGIELETTYSGKAMAALLADFRSGSSSTSQPLFWNTYNGAICPPSCVNRNPSRLPEELRRYLD